MKPSFRILSSALLFAAGTLFADPGAWRPLGIAGDYKNTVASVGIGDKLYTVETNGVLYITDTTTGQMAASGQTRLPQHQIALRGRHDIGHSRN